MNFVTANEFYSGSKQSRAYLFILESSNFVACENCLFCLDSNRNVEYFLTIFKILNGKWRNEEWETGNALENVPGNASGNIQANASGNASGNTSGNALGNVSGNIFWNA